MTISIKTKDKVFLKPHKTKNIKIKLTKNMKTSIEYDNIIHLEPIDSEKFISPHGITDVNYLPENIMITNITNSEQKIEKG